MNKKKPWIVAFMLVFGAVSVPLSLSQRTISGGTQMAEPEISLLEGLKGVTITVVQPVSGFEDRPRFNPVKVDDLHAKVEQTLSAAGMEVFESSDNDVEIAEVVVTVNVREAGSSIRYVVQIETEVYQLAELVRDNNIQMMVPTWPIGEKASEAEMTAVVSRGEIARTVRDEIEAQVKMLLNDFLEVNPELEPKLDISNMMTGTIRYVDVEGGCYNIFADNGRGYRPVNLPRAYRQHGLRVAFQAIRTEWTGIPYPGIPVKITRIVKL
jgi:hypothetical protein